MMYAFCIFLILIVCLNRLLLYFFLSKLQKVVVKMESLYFSVFCKNLGGCWALGSGVLKLFRKRQVVDQVIFEKVT